MSRTLEICCANRECGMLCLITESDLAPDKYRRFCSERCEETYYAKLNSNVQHNKPLDEKNSWATIEH